METPQKVRLWLYCRTLHGAPAIASNLSAYKHWAIAAEYLDEDSEVEMSELYEAVNCNGFVTASNAAFSFKRWMKFPGFERKSLKECYFSQASAIAFCNSVTERKEKYTAMEENCQKFVGEFIGHFTIDAALPTTAATASKVMSTTMSSSLNSIASMSCADLLKDFVIQNIIINEACDELFKEVIEKASFQGLGKVALLAESPLKEWIQENGKCLVLNSAGEWKETLLNASRGAFTWLQLLQIPVELITKKILMSQGLNKIDAHGLSKSASFLTSAGVGTVAGGPEGMAASVAFWIASEIASFFFRFLMEKVWPEEKLGFSFSSVFGDSETGELAKKIYSWFVTKINNGVLCGISWMIDYMKQTQGQRRLE